MGVIVYDFNVQFRIIPFNLESIQPYQKKYLTKLKGNQINKLTTNYNPINPIKTN